MNARLFIFIYFIYFYLLSVKYIDLYINIECITVSYTLLLSHVIYIYIYSYMAYVNVIRISFFFRMGIVFIRNAALMAQEFSKYNGVLTHRISVFVKQTVT